MRRALASCAALVLALVIAVHLMHVEPAAPVPARADMGLHPCNVVLVVVDTLRANRLSCYGYPRPTSPNIDRLAQHGTLYSGTHSQSCWTLTSMISMMTGKSLAEEVRSLPTAVPCLAVAMHDGGLETAAFVSNPVVGESSGFNRGFDEFESSEPVDAITVANRFCAWFDARGRVPPELGRRPFFAWVHFTDPHQPYEPDAQHDIFRGPRVDADVVLPRWRASQVEVPKISPGFVTPSLDECIARMMDDSNLYDGEVRAVDDGVGRILGALESSGELGDTLVILCADHGEMLYEHRQQPALVKSFVDTFGGLPEGMMNLFGCGHRPWFYEDLWNTPLIIAGPGVAAGVRRTGMTANLDIFPTCLDALQLPQCPGLEGTSLWRGNMPDRTSVFAYGHRTFAMFERGAKTLVLSPPALFNLPDDAPAPMQLYDLSRDPHQETDVAAIEPAETSRLRRQLDDWRKRSTRAWTGAYNAAQIQHLRNLGYTGEDD
jgi:arylsulfatase A-like enzyme